jgi:hypothetical protein
LDEGVQDGVVFQTGQTPGAQEDLAHSHNRAEALLGLIVGGRHVAMPIKGP